MGHRSPPPARPLGPLHRLESQHLRFDGRRHAVPSLSIKDAQEPKKQNTTLAPLHTGQIIHMAMGGHCAVCTVQGSEIGRVMEPTGTVFVSGIYPFQNCGNSTVQG